MWSLISAWDQYLPYYGDGLMNAWLPWLGQYEVTTPVWITAHTTQFVKSYDNWMYLKQGHGSGGILIKQNKTNQKKNNPFFCVFF